MRFSKAIISTICLVAMLWCGGICAAPKSGESSNIRGGLWHAPPKVDWGSRLEGKPARVSCLIPGGAGGDVEALPGRYRADLTTFALDVGGDATAVIDQALASEADVLLVAGVDAASFNDEQTNELIESMREGLAVAWVRFGDPLPDRLGRYLNSLPASDYGDWIDGGAPVSVEYELRAGERDRARFLDLNFSGQRPVHQALFPGSAGIREDLGNTYENRMSLLVRCLRWASRQEPEIYIDGLIDGSPDAPDAVSTPPQLPRQFVRNMIDATIQPPLVPYRLTFNAPLEKPLTLKIQARYPNRELRWFYWEDERLPKGIRQIALRIPVGRGPAYLDFWLMDGDDVVDWYTAAVSVDGWPRLHDVQLSRYAVWPSDTVEAIFTVQTNAHHPAPGTVVLRVTDVWGRLLYDTRLLVDETGGEMRTLLHLKDVLGPMLKVEIFCGGPTMGEIDAGAAERSDYWAEYLLVRQPPRSGFEIVTSGPARFEAELMSENFQNAMVGADAFYVGGGESDHVAATATGLLGIGQFTFLDDAEGHDWFRRDPNMVDGTTVLARREAVRAQSEEGFGRHVLSEGPVLRGWLRSNTSNDEITQILFRDWLEERYFNLGSLSRVTGTAYASWADVMPIAEGELGPVALQVLSREFREKILLKALGEVRGEFRRTSEAIRTGVMLAYEDDMTSYYPWRELSKQVDFAVVPADELLLKKIAKFAPDGTRLFAHVDKWSNDSAPEVSLALWRSVLSGAEGTWLPGQEPAMDGVWLEAASETLAHVRGGIDLVVAKGKALPARIAMLDSDSVRRVAGPGEYSRIVEAQRNMAEALNLAGYRFAFISEEELATLATSDYGCVVLPATSVVRDEDMLLLEQFAELGGVILADRTPGDRDDFGAERVSSLGQRSDLLLLSEIDSEEWPERIRSALVDRDIAPDVRLTANRFAPVEARSYGFHYGKAQVIGLISNSKDSRGSTSYLLDVPEGYFAYDMLAGEALNFKESLELRMKPEEVQVVSMLPYEVTRLVIAIPEGARQGQRVPVDITVKTRGGLAGDHVVTLELVNADGDALPWYTQSIECTKGFARAYIPLSLNETAGAYRIRVRDALTGVTTMASLNISRY